MSVEQKIEDCTPVLYSIVFEGETNRCMSRTCEKGKCICMDTEQSGLLRKLLCEQDQVVAKLNGEKRFFKNLQYKPCEDWLCEDSLNFFPCRKMEEKIIEEYLNVPQVEANKIEKILKNIPLIFLINSTETIENRKTLLYLCVLSEYSEEWLGILFNAVLNWTVKQCLEVKEEEKEASAKLLAEVFCGLNEIKQFSRENRLWVVDKYIGALLVQSKGRFRNLGHHLKQIRNAWLKDDVVPMENALKEKIYKRYILLKKMLEVSGIPTTEFPQLHLLTGVPETINDMGYVDCIRILDAVKEDTDVRRELLEDIKGRMEKNGNDWDNYEEWKNWEDWKLRLGLT